MKILGTACGVGVEGSGWFARPTLVVTAAHVVAGEHDTAVLVPGEHAPAPRRRRRRSTRTTTSPCSACAVQAARRCRFGDPQAGRAVAILGYPENGPLTVVPGRVGKTTEVLTRDAYGRGPVGAHDHGRRRRTCATATRAAQQSTRAARSRGDDLRGARRRPDAASASRPSILRRALGKVQRPVSTGGCAAG